MEYLKTLTLEIVQEWMGQTISYYELWDVGEDPFFGSAKIKSIETDKYGKQRIVCEVLWGSDLWEAYLYEDYFVWGDDKRPLYFGPPHFEVYQIHFKNESGEPEEKLVLVEPGEFELFFDDMVRSLTNGDYTVKRVH